jgi:hypothetical protein
MLRFFEPGRIFAAVLRIPTKLLEIIVSFDIAAG